MSRLRIAIADDEPMARLRVQRLLALDADVDVVAVCPNADALVDVLRAQRVDALLLDIGMPGKNVFAAWNELAEPRPRVVFVTAYAEYAAKAFEIDASDYLVKPVSQDRLFAAIERVRRDLAAVRPAAVPRRIALPIGRRIRLVDLEAIDHVVAQANYLEIHVESRSLVLRRPISWMEEQLDSRHFVRVHRSHVVRIHAVDHAEPLPSGRYRLRLKTGTVLCSSRRYRDAIRLALGIE
jgi:two-component system LytT family response regulator